MSSLQIRQLTDSGGTNDIAPTTVPQAVIFPDGSNLNTTIGSIATIETSPSTHAYAVGDFLVWNGQLYKVTAAIAIGESLTVGTNIESTSVGDEISSLNSSLIVYRDTSIGTITIPSSGYYLLTGKIPSVTGYNLMFVQVQNYGQGHGALSIDTSGSYLSGGAGE